MADVNIVIDIIAKGAVKELSKIEKEFDDLSKEAKNSGKETDKSLGLISKGAAGAAVAIAGIGLAIGSAVGQASKLQDLETQFIAFTGSAEGAAEQVERIAEFSGQTPFQLEQLVTANRTLLAFGQTTEESLTTLNQLGDVAAGTGADLNDLALIFGQVEAAGKLTGERFLQFAERGINLAPILAKQLGVAETEIAELRKQGKITADDVAKAFETMTAEGGKFAGSMERLSRTFSGATSTLSDNISLLAGDLGKKLLPGITGITVAFTEAVQWVRQFTKETKADRVEAFNNQILTTERTIENLNQQIGAAEKGGFFFELFAGDPTKEAERLNKELASAEKSLAALQAQRDKTQARPESDFDDPKPKGPQVDKQAVEQSKAINDELLELSRQRAATERLISENKNTELAEQLDIQRETILAKEEEKNIALLESQGLYDEAQLLRAESQAQSLNDLKKRQEEEALRNSKQAQRDEFNFAKMNADARAKFDRQTWTERARTAQTGLSAIAALSITGNRQLFEVAKAASIAQTLIAIPEAAQKAYTSLAAFPPLAAAAAAAAVTVGVARVEQIRKTKITGFSEGGLVTGGVPGQDSVPALLTPGEVVVPEKNFDDVMRGENRSQDFMALNRTLEEQNAILFNISQSTNDTAIGTANVAFGVANINLPGQNNPGAGADYTDFNIRTFAEVVRYNAQKEAEAAGDELAQINAGVSTSTSGQAQVSVG
jgi:tape measure domain-containing protein